jgi:cytochrome P450
MGRGGRNKTPAERALEVICTMAGIPFSEFEQLLKKSQGDRARERDFPESSYFNNSSISKDEWRKLFQHCKEPKSNFGK